LSFVIVISFSIVRPIAADASTTRPYFYFRVMQLCLPFLSNL